MLTSELSATIIPARRPEPVTASVLVPTSVVAREAVIAAIIAGGLAMLWSPAQLGGSGPHPAWAAVLVLAARYGSRGLAVVLPAAWAMVALVSWGSGAAPGAWAGMSVSGANLAALTVSIVVAWVASVHERRAVALAGKLTESERRCAADQAALIELRHAAMALRSRADQVEHSLTFLRDVAGRLEGNDPVEAAQAALDLVIARTGARAGMVQVAERGMLRTLVRSGAWSLESPLRPDLLRDRTAYLAIERGGLALSSDLEKIGPLDSDAAAPIFDRAGELLGILALRGLSPHALPAAAGHDLTLVASWCGKSLAAARVGRLTSSDLAAEAPLGARHETTNAAIHLVS